MGVVRTMVVQTDVDLLATVRVAEPLLEQGQKMPEVDVVGGVVDLAVHVLLERGTDGSEDSASMLNERQRVGSQTWLGPSRVSPSAGQIRQKELRILTNS